MTYFHLLWANLGRKKIRTGLTMLSIFVAFLLYGLLIAIRSAFGVGVDITGLDRLLTIHKVSLIQPLPISYLNRISATEGVSDATFAVWFGGIYQDPKNFFAQHAVDPEAWLRLYPEFVLPEEQKQAWYANRTGAIVGRMTAERFGWEIG
ncbi:MAG: ABC transporter permease, partial [Acidobacteriota bacterium]